MLNENNDLKEMLPETEEISLQQQFEEVIATENKLAIQEFLNNQNISDVAELIYENPDYESQIISHKILAVAAVAVVINRY